MTKCPYCGRKAKLVDGSYFHPNTKYIDKNYFVCPGCDAHVGCHRGTSIPLGTLANAELRKKRILLHQTFDLSWKYSKALTRRQSYISLSIKLNIPLAKCHIALFDLDMCDKAMEALLCG